MSEASAAPLATTSLLMRAQRNCRTAMDAALQVHGLSAAQYGVLRRLDDDPGLSGAELARRLHVTAQTMNRLIAALEEAGLIERFPDAAGGRTLRARPTAPGRDAITAARRTVEAVEARMLSGLDLREQTLLADMLRRCVEALDLPARRAEAEAWQPRVVAT